VAAVMTTAASAAEPPSASATLAAREAELLQRYRDLEASFLRLADALAATDPVRAAVLRSAFDRGREARVGDRIAAIVEQLEEGQLLKAGTAQLDAIQQFRALLELLESGGGDGRLAETKKDVKELIGRVAKIVSRQREVEAATERGDEASPLAERQRAVADDARRLADDVEAFARRGEDRGEGGAPAAAGREPSGEAPPDGQGAEDPGAKSAGGDQADEAAEDGDDEAARSRRTARRLQAAEQRMQAARGRLEEARRDDARQEQERAVEELETARAELEEILRQVREEEVERILVQLEARIRGMLKAERAVLADAEALAAAAPASSRERQLEAARLGREQERIGADAGRAIALVRDDGSAVAIPQALEQVRDDAVQAAARLTRGDVGRETVAILGDIVSGLEEMLAAVEKAHRDRGDRRPGQGGGAANAAGEQPLVDALAELKMLRTLQVRVNARTQRLGRLLDDEPVDDPEIRGVLARLAERQRAIERAARDIVGGLAE
jgi:hypothetical protein